MDHTGNRNYFHWETRAENLNIIKTSPFNFSNYGVISWRGCIDSEVKCLRFSIFVLIGKVIMDILFNVWALFLEVRFIRSTEILGGIKLEMPCDWDNRELNFFHYIFSIR